MGWVYLDDNFVDHPKIDKAGGDAGWLYVCGLSFARRNATEGTIPKHRLARISDRENPEALAAVLVKVGLWVERKDHYEIHDYGMWNAKAEKRRVQAQAAAKKRWDKEKADAESMREQMREHEQTQMPPDDETHMQEHDEAEQCESNAYMGLSPSPKPHPDPQSSSGLVSEEPRGDRPASDDDVWKSWALRDRQRLHDETGQWPHDDASWLAKAGNTRKKNHAGEVKSLLAVEPDLAPEDVIDRLEKGKFNGKSHPQDTMAAAARALAEKDRSCPHCGGSNMRETDAGAVPCDHSEVPA